VTVEKGRNNDEHQRLCREVKQKCNEAKENWLDEQCRVIEENKL